MGQGTQAADWTGAPRRDFRPDQAPQVSIGSGRSAKRRQFI